MKIILYFTASDNYDYSTYYEYDTDTFFPFIVYKFVGKVKKRYMPKNSLIVKA